MFIEHLWMPVGTLRTQQRAGQVGPWADVQGREHDGGGPFPLNQVMLFFWAIVEKPLVISPGGREAFGGWGGAWAFIYCPYMSFSSETFSACVELKSLIRKHNFKFFLVIGELLEVCPIPPFLTSFLILPFVVFRRHTGFQFFFFFRLAQSRACRSIL